MQQVDAPHTVIREELYEAVWEKPMRHLAKEYGLSDVGLAKLCRRHQIPTPPVGYWMKLQHGKQVERPELPILTNPSLASIVIEPHVISERRSQMPKREIAVPIELRSPHPLIAKTAAALRKAKPDEQGLLRPGVSPALPIAVGRGSVDRALRILDALFKAVEESGYPVGIADENGRASGMIATVYGEPVSFALVEELQREERPLTTREQREQEQYPWMHSRPLYRYLPTGRLRLQILTPSESWCRRRWSDGERQRLENCLGAFILQAEIIAEERKAEHQRQRERQERYEAWQRERAQKLELIREEEERVKRLHAEVDAWHRSERIRRYVDTVREALIARDGSVPADGESRWLLWASQQADRLDPLVESPPSILDEKAKYERYDYRP